jgi:5'-methylthioinosine phosphorylase
MKLIGIIGGSGLTELPGLSRTGQKELNTPYGPCSAALQLGEIARKKLVFLPRHGHPHRIPPHCINYRANIWALREIGVDAIIAVNAVGGIGDHMDAGHIAIPDQIIDYTYGREHTYSDGADVNLQHIDFSYPYDESLRQELLAAAAALELPVSDKATYGATQGPRLESAAEIIRMANDGCHIVGMTGMPEAGLARELDLPYAVISLVVNRAAGLSEGIITMEEIEHVMESGMEQVLLLLQHFLDR